MLPRLLQGGGVGEAALASVSKDSSPTGGGSRARSGARGASRAPMRPEATDPPDELARGSFPRGKTSSTVGVARAGRRSRS
eukprot:5082424-Alexandrium_andersonii.AAC.1